MNGIKIPKKYFTNFSAITDIPMLSLFGFSKLKVIPATAPDNIAKSLEMTEGSENEKRGTTTDFPCDMTEITDIGPSFRQQLLSKYDRKVFMKFEQHISGIMSIRSFNEPTPIRPKDV
jgi:hypothetical protein